MSGVNTFTNNVLGLAHEFTNEEYIRSGTISDNVILGSGSTPNHSCSWMLDLHFVEKDSSILCELDLASASNEHFDRSFRSEVRLQDFLESFSSIDVDTEGSSLPDNVGFCVNELK
jgi:hypothetical protein